jgi:hypothetical protein
MLAITPERQLKATTGGARSKQLVLAKSYRTHNIEHLPAMRWIRVEDTGIQCSSVIEGKTREDVLAWYSRHSRVEHPNRGPSPANQFRAIHHATITP